MGDGGGGRARLRRGRPYGHGGGERGEGEEEAVAGAVRSALARPYCAVGGGRWQRRRGLQWREEEKKVQARGRRKGMSQWMGIGRLSIVKTF